MTKLRYEVREAADKSNGIYLLRQEFGRGIDFKLLEKAYVVVLMNGSLELTEADVDQMAGRGNRS